MVNLKHIPLCADHQGMCALTGLIRVRSDRHQLGHLKEKKGVFFFFFNCSNKTKDVAFRHLLPPVISLCQVPLLCIRFLAQTHLFVGCPRRCSAGTGRK